MPRTYLVASAEQAPGRLLHRYAGGAAAVTVPSAAAPPENATESAGLRLAAPKAVLTAARRSIREGAEDEADVSAYLEFIAPPDPRWLAQVQALGLTVLGYQPENSYLVWGRRRLLALLAERIRTSEGESAVRSVTELTNTLKNSPPVLAESGETVVVVLAASGPDRQRVSELLGGITDVSVLPGAGNDVLDEQRVRVRARVGQEGLAALLALPRVLAVETFAGAVPEDEIAGLVLAGQLDAGARPWGSYDRWLEDHGLDGGGAVIGIVDQGVDVAHPAFVGRIRDLADGRRSWHGTMVAGHAAGDYRDELDAQGFVYGLGTAPAALLLSQSVDQAGRQQGEQTIAESAGAIAIQNNSWGRGRQNPMDYMSDESLYDALARDAGRGRPLTICFSSGNNGAAGLTRPKAAKNIIVTGNSENFRPLQGADSDDVREVYNGRNPSSHGNCADGRIRPHVVAPGEWTTSANYDSYPDEREYVSPRITYGGGSSGASPKTAGACALLAQWWRRWHGDVDPSPAMLRALIVNGAVPILAGGPVPNVVQGWGRLSLQELLDPEVARIAVDQTVVLSAMGQTRQWTVRAVDPRRPVKVTLAWTDPPGAIGTGAAAASCIVNRLALRVQDGSRIWRGGADRFARGWTREDGELASAGSLRPEGSDNLQCVFLPPGEAMRLVVSVTALTLTTDALNGGFGTPQQDFALVITNAQIDPGAPSLMIAGVAVQESFPNDQNPVEAAWWAAGEPNLPQDDDVPESLRRGTSALEAGGRHLDPLEGAGLSVLAEQAFQRLADGAAQEAVVVLGLPRGTGVTREGVAGVRRLAGAAEVRLVCEDAELLTRLVLTIGPHTRIRPRLAEEAALVATVCEAVLESAGLQRVLPGDGAFGVVHTDQTLVLSFPAGTHEVAVLAPGEREVVLSPKEPAAEGMRLVDRGQQVDLVIAEAGARPGAWSVKSGAQQEPEAWVHGGVALSVAAPEIGEARNLLRVQASGETRLRQLSIRRSRLDPAHPRTEPESDRPIVVRALPSRLERMGEAGEVGEAGAQVVGVPALAHPVQFEAGVPAVLDIPVDVVGQDQTGTVFARRARSAVISWGPQTFRPEPEPSVSVTGRLEQLVYRDEVLTGVQVTDGRRTRLLEVRDDVLRQALPLIGRTQPVVLTVVGNRLLSVFRPFPPANAT